MVKKTLLSMAIAAAVVSIAGCNVSSTDKYDNKIIDNAPGSAELQDVGNLYPIFAPERGELPLATDLVFAKAGDTDGTADTADTQPPVTTALNKLAGFSTTSPIYINFEGDPDPQTVIAGQTVFLIKLKTGQGIDALDLKSIMVGTQGAPVAAAQPNGLGFVGAVDYTADVVKLGNQSAVRILLEKPLEPKTKYIVALTNGITDGTNNATGSSTYQITSSNNVLPSNALAPVREAVQGWEAIAGGYVGQYSTAINGMNPAYPLIDQDNIILSYAFTTDGSQDVLKSYAAPFLFIKNNMSVADAEKATDEGSPLAAAGVTNVVARSIYAQSPYVGALPTDSDYAAKVMAVTDAQIELVKTTPSFGYEAALYGAIAQSEFPGTNASLSTYLASAAEAPKVRTVKEISPIMVDGLISANLGAPGASPATFGTSQTDITTRYIQGTITLPNFLGDVAKTNLSGIDLSQGVTAANKDELSMRIGAAMKADGIWEASTIVGQVIDGMKGQPAGTTPPKDVNGSTNVTYRYPFAQLKGMVDAPYLLTLPDITVCGGNKLPTAIFVHGITSNRSGSAAYAAQLAEECIATVAIDLPMHGVAPADGAQIAFSLDTDNASKTKSPWASVAAGVAGGAPVSISERHSNVWQNDSSIRTDMNYDVIADAADLTDLDEVEAMLKSGGTSGSAFINLQNFARTHDNLRQAVTDLLNVNMSLSAIHADLDTDKVFVVGHSLGGIVASAFVAANNDPEVQASLPALPEIKGLIIANSGAHITKLLENSPAFAPQIVAGLAQSGISQGSESFEKFLYVFQSMIDGIDPANTASNLHNTPVKMFTVVGDGTVTPPDNTVPVFDYFADETSNPFKDFVSLENGPIKLPSAGVPTAKAPLAGTKGLMVVNSALATGNTDITTPGATHSSFANGEPLAAFGQMALESIQFIQAN